MNHINEGLIILNSVGAESEVKNAWCIHPIFQDDKALVTVAQEDVYRMDPTVVLLAMEYRTTANAYRSVHYRPDFVPKISLIYEVNMMLKADKIQNKKDFTLHQKPNANLIEYYNQWFRALSITTSEYEESRNLIT